MGCLTIEEGGGGGGEEAEEKKEEEGEEEAFLFNLLAPELLLFFLILAHPVHKMWIKKELNMSELSNKLHFEEEKTDSIYHV